jgi:hypothetical protein
MKKPVASVKGKQRAEASSKTRWVAGLIIVLAIGACFEVYKHSASKEVVSLVPSSTSLDAKEAAAPASSATVNPETKTSDPGMKEVAF